MNVRVLRYMSIVVRNKQLSHVKSARPFRAWYNVNLATCLISPLQDTNINPIQTGGGLLRPYQTLKLNNFKTVKAMTTKFSDFS